jgi:hypothetical protein
MYNIPKKLSIIFIPLKNEKKERNQIMASFQQILLLDFSGIKYFRKKNELMVIHVYKNP